MICHVENEDAEKRREDKKEKKEVDDSSSCGPPLQLVTGPGITLAFPRFLLPAESLPAESLPAGPRFDTRQFPPRLSSLRKLQLLKKTFRRSTGR